MQENDLQTENVAEFRIRLLIEYVYFVALMTAIFSGLMLLSLKPGESLGHFISHRTILVSTAAVLAGPPHNTRSQGEQSHDSTNIPFSSAIANDLDAMKVRQSSESRIRLFGDCVDFREPAPDIPTIKTADRYHNDVLDPSRINAGQAYSYGGYTI